MVIPELGFDINLSIVALSLARALVVIAVAYAVARVMKRAIPAFICENIPKIREESDRQLATRATTLTRVLTQIASAVIWGVAFLMVLTVLGVDVTPVLATVGIPALAVGFAAQNIIRDYFHGFFIIMEDWYRVGEVAVIGGTGGTVEDISLRRTVLRDLDGTIHIFPNGQVQFASNMTRDWSRINLNVSVAYKEDLDRVFRVINDVCQCLKSDPVWGHDLLSTPRVERVDNLGDNGVEIKILGDTKPIKQWALSGELRKRLKERFDQEGIEISWPRVMVYFGNQMPTSNPYTMTASTMDKASRDDR